MHTHTHIAVSMVERTISSRSHPIWIFGKISFQIGILQKASSVSLDRLVPSLYHPNFISNTCCFIGKFNSWYQKDFDKNLQIITLEQNVFFGLKNRFSSSKEIEFWLYILKHFDCLQSRKLILSDKKNDTFQCEYSYRKNSFKLKSRSSISCICDTSR